MKKHEIRKGKHRFNPGHKLGLGFRSSGFNLDFNIPLDAWFDPTEGPLGRDGLDICKLGGVSFFNPINPFTWPAHKSSILVGWRPHPEEGKFEIFAYINDKEGNRDRFFLGLANAAGVYTVTVERIDSEHHLYVFSSRGERIGQVLMETYARSFQVNIGPYFGGNQTAPFSFHLYADQQRYTSVQSKGGLTSGNYK